MKAGPFEVFLENYWPLWRQHIGSKLYNDLKAAFEAGFCARQLMLERDAKREFGPDILKRPKVGRG